MTFEEILRRVKSELIKEKDLSADYIKGVNDTLVIVKRLLDIDGDDRK